MTAHIIYKYILDLDDEVNVIPMHEGATFLHVEAVNDQVCVWAREKPDQTVIPHSLGIILNTTPMTPDIALGRHIGSTTLLSGQLAVHVFDLGVVVP